MKPAPPFSPWEALGRIIVSLPSFEETDGAVQDEPMGFAEAEVIRNQVYALRAYISGLHRRDLPLDRKAIRARIKAATDVGVACLEEEG